MGEVCNLNNTNDEILTTYLESSIGKIYKIIPLNEEYNNTIKTYIKSLKIELSGALSNFARLRFDGNFMGIINTLEYMIKNDFDNETCKREIFKCIKTIELIIKKVGDSNEHL